MINVSVGEKDILDISWDKWELLVIPEFSLVGPLMHPAVYEELRASGLMLEPCAGSRYTIDCANEFDLHIFSSVWLVVIPDVYVSSDNQNLRVQCTTNPLREKSSIFFGRNSGGHQIHGLLRASDPPRL